MRFDPEKHHRSRLWLQGSDSIQAEAYFLAICLQNRECLFDEVVGVQMWLKESEK